MPESYEELDPERILLNIYKRTTCRDFSSAPVEDAKIQLILEAARFAPNSGNIQNWNFILVKKQKTKEKVASACFDQHWISEANTLIVIVTDETMAKRFYYEDGHKYSMQGAAMAAENMLIAARSLNLGSAFVSAINETEMKKALSIPDYEKVQGVVAIGEEKHTAIPQERKTLYDLCYVEKFNGRIQNEDFVLYDFNILGLARDALNEEAPKIMEAVKEGVNSARFELLNKQLELKNRQIRSLKEDLEGMHEKLKGGRNNSNIRSAPRAPPNMNVTNNFYEGPWSYHVLKHAKGLHFPAGEEELKEKLSGIKVGNENIEEIIDRIELPVDSHAQLLKKIKQAVSSNR